MGPGDLRVLLLAAAISSIAPPAFACISVTQHTITLLPELPATADREDVIAKIEVIELVEQPWPANSDYTSLARVRVIQAIKGTEDGKVILVATGGGSCDDVFSQRTLGTQAYIAGRITTNARGEGIFEGRWCRPAKPTFPFEFTARISCT
jgi:hypothetical protein